MASTPQTQGFQMSVMPGYQLANPSYFNTGAPLSQGISSGVGLGGQLADIVLRSQQQQQNNQLFPLKQQALQAELQQNAAMNPLRQQALQDELQNNAAMNPLRQQALQVELQRSQAAAHLAEIQLPGQEILAGEDIRIPRSTFTDKDDQGNLAKYGSFKVINPKTREVSYSPRNYLETLRTAQQLKDDEANAQAMRDYRSSMASTAGLKAATANEVALYMKQNPTLRNREIYDGASNVYNEIINPDGSIRTTVRVILPGGEQSKRPALSVSAADALAAVFAPKPGATGASAAQGVPVRVMTQAQYDALPPGVSYIDSTGQQGFKGKK